MSAHSPLRNGIFALLGQVGSRLLALVFVARFARQVGPDLYGDYGLGASFGILFVVLVEPGLNQLLTRDGARDRAQLPALASLSLGYKLAAITLAWPAMVGTAALLGYRGTSLWSVLLAGGCTLLLGLEDFASSILVAQERMDLESGLRLSSKLLFSGSGLVVLALGGDFVHVLATLTVCQAIAAVMGLVLISRVGVPVRPSFDPRSIRARIIEAAPLAVTGVLWLLTLRLDQVIASQMGVPRGDLGDYNGAVKLVEALLLFPSAVLFTFQPLMARAWTAGPAACASEVELALSTSLGMTLPVAAGGAWLARPLAMWVYGPSFAPVGSLFAIQLLGLLAVAVQFSCFPAMVAAGAMTLQTRISAVNLILNVGLNLLLVPRLGVRGSSWAAAMGGIAASIGCLAALRGLGMHLNLVRVVWRPALATAAMGAFLAAVGDRLPLIPEIAGGAVAYVGVFGLIGGGAVVRDLRAHRRVAATP